MAAKVTMFALVMFSLVTYAVSPNHKIDTKTHVACCVGDPMCSPTHGCPPEGSTK